MDEGASHLDDENADRFYQLLSNISNLTSGEIDVTSEEVAPSSSFTYVSVSHRVNALKEYHLVHYDLKKNICRH